MAEQIGCVLKDKQMVRLCMFGCTNGWINDCQTNRAMNKLKDEWMNLHLSGQELWWMDGQINEGINGSTAG